MFFDGFFQIKDINFNVNTGSGGRILSQTLDESEHVVDIIQVFDLIAETLTDNEKMLIEYNLFRSMVRKISQNFHLF